jgi:hypothetical protein
VGAGGHVTSCYNKQQHLLRPMHVGCYTMRCDCCRLGVACLVVAVTSDPMHWRILLTILCWLSHACAEQMQQMAAVDGLRLCYCAVHACAGQRFSVCCHHAPGPYCWAASSAGLGVLLGFAGIHVV